jgi:hypothetical protein
MKGNLWRDFIGAARDEEIGDEMYRKRFVLLQGMTGLGRTGVLKMLGA